MKGYRIRIPKHCPIVCMCICLATDDAEQIEHQIHVSWNDKIGRKVNEFALDQMFHFGSPCWSCRRSDKLAYFLYVILRQCIVS